MTILGAMLAQIALTIFVLLRLAYSRYIAIKNREVRIKDVALNNDAFPDYARKISNNYDNQFQMPVLFYVMGLLCLQLNYTPLFMLVSAWGFVAFRILHMIIHTGSNIVNYRFLAFLASNLCLMLMFLGLVFKAL